MTMPDRWRVSKTIADTIRDDSEAALPANWTRFVDRDGEQWAQTPYEDQGSPVMVPNAGDLEPMRREDVEFAWGPLKTAADYDDHLSKLNEQKAAVHAKVLNDAADLVAELRDKTDINVAEYPRYDFRQRIALGDAENELRRTAKEASAS